MPARILTVQRGENGSTVLDWLRQRLHLSADEARRLLHGRKVRIGGTPCSNPAWKVRTGQRVEVSLSGPSRPDRSAPASASPRRPLPVLRFVDEHLVIVDKPAGLTTMRHAEEAAEFGARGRRFLPETLEDLLPALVAAHTGEKPGTIRAVHRLDRDTSGLLVFARTPLAVRHLGQQFREHMVERRYLALVRGEARDARIESSLVRDRGDGRRGSGPGEGQHAVTHVRVVERLGPCTLVECQLETGRTHQVRIHLGEAGTPLCGERIYDRPIHGRPHPDPGGIDRIALHAASLGLEHPATGELLHFQSDPPADMAILLKRLRKGGA